MNDIPKDIDQQLAQLVISLQMGAMQQMGKVASPVTGKVERDLTIAQATIDLIAMLERKMTGNLSDEEKKFISHVLYELRMNFIDESKKQQDQPSEKTEEKTEPVKPEEDKPDEKDSK